MYITEQYDYFHYLDEFSPCSLARNGHRKRGHSESSNTSYSSNENDISPHKKMRSIIIQPPAFNCIPSRSTSESQTSFIRTARGTSKMLYEGHMFVLNKKVSIDKTSVKHLIVYSIFFNNHMVEYEHCVTHTIAFYGKNFMDQYHYNLRELLLCTRMHIIILLEA